MSIFADLAIDQLASDLGEDATFCGTYGEVAALRVMVGEVDGVQEMGRSRSSSTTALIEMRRADLPRQPVKGDVVEIGEEVWKLDGPGRVDRDTLLVAVEAHRGMAW